jgi:hypothetical protein
MNSAPESGEAFRRARLIAGAARFSRGARDRQGGSIVARRPFGRRSAATREAAMREHETAPENQGQHDRGKHWNRDNEMKPGAPPRTAYEPKGSEGSTASRKTATDPASGAPSRGPPDPDPRARTSRRA